MQNIMSRIHNRTWLTPTLAMIVGAVFAAPAMALTEEEEKAILAKVIGPEKYDGNCSSCHALEHETWKQTSHFATFASRHRTDEAKAILKNMGQRSMKSAGDCRNCHYTSKLSGTRIRAEWGVSCESCHSPGLDWNEIHNKVGGDPNATVLELGTGKDQSPENRAKRLAASQKLGMINSSMIYDIATNCFSCHTVPNEELVNKGQHKAGSDFDLVAWSQGEVRHNFLETAASTSPKNRKSSPEQVRRLYVVGAMVDLEITLRNITNLSEKGGAYHKAMVERANKIREKVKAILGAQAIAELADAVAAVPGSIDESTTIDAGLPDKLGDASRAFLANHDGSGLGAIDALLPTEYKGTAYKE
ncbi:MAG: multiheme c-type cytochrome [Planctomycetota bacterium]|jgi:hypothetical protein